MPEHFCAGMSDELQLVLVGGGYPLHHGGEGMTAAVRCVASALDAVDLLHRVVDAAAVQHVVKDSAVLFDGERPAVWPAKHRAGRFALSEPLNDGLNLGGNRHYAIPSGIRFGQIGRASCRERV